MSTSHASTADRTTLLDRSDVRVKHATGVGGAVGAFIDRVRSGDLGSLPVVVGLVDHLDGVHRASTRSSCRAEQSGEPAVRLLDGRA